MSYENQGLLVRGKNERGVSMFSLMYHCGRRSGGDMVSVSCQVCGIVTPSAYSGKLNHRTRLKYSLLVKGPRLKSTERRRQQREKL